MKVLAKRFHSKDLPTLDWHCFVHYYLQNAEKLDLMKKAIGAHNNYTKEVPSGRGLLPRDHSK